MPTFIVNGYPVTAQAPHSSWVRNADGTYASSPGVTTGPGRLIKPDPATEPVQVLPSTIQAANSWHNVVGTLPRREDGF